MNYVMYYVVSQLQALKLLAGYNPGFGDWPISGNN